MGGKYQLDHDMVQVSLLIHHLRRLGYRAELDGSMEQPTRNACGYVAALAAARLGEEDWKEADVSLAVQPNIISNARASWLKLDACAEDESPGLRADQVDALYSFFMLDHSPSRAYSGWNGAGFGIVPFDVLWTLVEEDTRMLAADIPDTVVDPFVKVLVCNTDVSGMDGSHWFAVAYGID